MQITDHTTLPGDQLLNIRTSNHKPKITQILIFKNKMLYNIAKSIVLAHHSTVQATILAIKSNLSYAAGNQKKKKTENPINVTKSENIINLHSSPLVFTWTKTFKGFLPMLATTRSS